MNATNMNGQDAEKVRKADACFACGGVMWLSAVAILFVLMSWGVGGQAYFDSIFGPYILAGLVLVFVVGALRYRAARKRAAE